CKTPSTRNCSRGSLKGKALSNNPKLKMTTNRRIIRNPNALDQENSDLRNEKNIAAPTINKKKGNTRSVGVQPCQSACWNGAYISLHEPGVLTRIINAIVN